MLALTEDLDYDSKGPVIQVFLTEIIKKAPIVYVEGNHEPFVRDKETGGNRDTVLVKRESGQYPLYDLILVGHFHG